MKLAMSCVWGAIALLVQSGLAVETGWELDGNGEATGSSFVGTTNQVPLVLKANARRAIMVTTPSDGHFAVVIGGTDGELTNARQGTVIGFAHKVSGSALGPSISGGYGNTLADTTYGAIGGGTSHTISNSVSSAIMGGWYGRIFGSRYTFIGGGSANMVDTNSHYSTIGGGGNQLIGANSEKASIAGGTDNVIRPSSLAATIGGGMFNTASGQSSLVAGGQNNQALGFGATVGGGYQNTNISAYGTIPGGWQCIVTGTSSFAAGSRAVAAHPGSFVWADAPASPYPHFSSSTANQFAVRAKGGVWFVSGVDAAGATTSGVWLASGSGSWTSYSDRNGKENLEVANPDDVLNRLMEMPVYTWNYRTQQEDIRHIGPTAQDFNKAFGYGDSDRGITAVDADGVALAAIQALTRRLEKLERENEALRSALHTR